MLVSREEGDCRSEPDTTLAMAATAATAASANMSTTAAASAAVPSQLIVPVTVAALPVANAPLSSPTGTQPANPLVTSTSDQAQRRRRLSNLYKVSYSLSPYNCKCSFILCVMFINELTCLLCAAWMMMMPTDNELRVLQHQFRLFRGPGTGGVCCSIQRN